MNKIFSIIFICSLINFSLFSQIQNGSSEFEGTIRCLHKTQIDTIFITYIVKNNFVAMEESFTNFDSIANSLIFDLKNNQIVAAHYQRKLLMKLPTTPYYEIINKDIKIEKSNKKVSINKFVCEEWKIINKDINREIIYLVTNDRNYRFYSKLLKLWNRKDAIFSNFLLFNDTTGFFPIAIIEKTLDKKIVTETQTISINPDTLTFLYYERENDPPKYPDNDKIEDFIRYRKEITNSNKVISENHKALKDKDIQLIESETIINQKNQIIYLVLVVTVLFLLMSLLFIKFYVSKRKSEKSLLKHKSTINQQNNKLREQNDNLQSVINELRSTQKQLVESEKMASLGGLVAGVAHEINTPVGIGITASSALLEKTIAVVEKYKQGNMKRTDFEEFMQKTFEASKLILSNLERTGELVQSFKQVSVDQSVEEKRKFNLKNYIEDIVRSVKPKLKNTNINIEIDCPEEIELYNYPGAFAQIFTNFIVNSKIHGFKDKEEGLIKIEAEFKSKKLIIQYSDNGRGMNNQVKERIFEPFFTTNKQEGTGLGMHIIYNLVNQKLNGTITCESELGKGVNFTIILPVN